MTDDAFDPQDAPPHPSHQQDEMVVKLCCVQFLEMEKKERGWELLYNMIYIYIYLYTKISLKTSPLQVASYPGGRGTSRTHVCGVLRWTPGGQQLGSLKHRVNEWGEQK